MSDPDRVPLVSSTSTEPRPLRISRMARGKIRTCLCVVGVFLGILALSAIAVVIAVIELRKKYTATVEMSGMSPNLTWAVPFNGKYVEQVTLEVDDFKYVSYMNLSAYPRMPQIKFYRRYRKEIGNVFLFANQIIREKMFLNTGSRIDVSFCFDTVIRVVVMQYTGVVNDIDYSGFQQYVRLDKTFVCLGNCSQNCSFNHTEFFCSQTGIYQFLFTPSSLALLVYMYDVEFSGVLTEYDLVTGRTDFCNTSMRYTDCSVSLPREEGAAVVIDVGDIPMSPGTNLDIAVVLKGKLRGDFVGTLASGVIGCGAALTAGILIIWLINRNNKREDADNSDEETVIT
ncbi:uncharacterized protein LOC134180152 isoform X1 [Corticium candelabrum]|uniref:uncharacterized protein LOC134180152 isoform X1 n=2 Tax=Corticium candelabrum TaxID=121492 RepID=UPI002E2673B7|nr:uncharacterized protein LOC134180152 isoform X1 [Corticium candelabrum]